MTKRPLAAIPLLITLMVVMSAARGDERLRAQGTARPTPEAVLLAIDRLLADRWYPAEASAGAAAASSADRQIFDAALASPRAELRRPAVRAVGRFESPRDVPRLVPMLDDADAGVRREAAFAIGQALHRSTGADVQGAAAALRARFTRETDARVKETIVESIARLPYDAATSAQVIADRSVPIGFDGIQRVLQRLRTVQIDDATRQDLRRAAAGRPITEGCALCGPQLPDVRALEILATIGDTGLDAAAVTRAVTYRCVGAVDPDCGADVRYAGLGLLDARNEAHKAALTAALADPAFRVRFQAARKIKIAAATPAATAPGAAPGATGTGAAAAATGRWSCAVLLDAITDQSPALAGHRIEAISLLDARCEERDAATARLKVIAGRLADAREHDRWHVPARALETLVLLDPAEARRLVDEVGSTHAVPWVRAAAARAAAALEHDAALVRLAGDTDANVRTEAITMLTRRKHAGLAAIAVRALEGTDYQLLLTAASALRGAKPDATVVPALVAALMRVTKEGKDTSRDPRVEMLRRLREMAAPDASKASAVQAHRGDLQSLLVDFDPMVAAAAADVLGAATGTRPDPRPTRRAPQQPTEALLRALPRSAVITMADGATIHLALYPDDAPFTVARFVTLARAGYYNGLTFHRIAPYFVVQGGSPGANEYAGDARFMRDEIGFQRHAIGSVGISTRGRDTGDAQIFIDLVDVHRLDFDYTVFARVTRGRPVAPDRDMAAVTAMQAGARITAIRIGG